MNPRPPARVTLLWCPACGRDDRYNDLKRGAGRHFADGSKCLGEPEEVEYRIPFAPQPPVGQQDGAYRAAVAVQVAIRPGPQHLTDDARMAFVGQTQLLYADTVEELALLVESFAELITNHLGDQIAIHPRPTPPPGWPT